MRSPSRDLASASFAARAAGPSASTARVAPRRCAALLTTLEEGSSVGLTADVPRTGGIAGLGIITLARLSGRPIVPVAVATSNMIRLSTWDRATLNLPYSRGAFVVGELVRVPAEADAGMMERKRQDLERALDAAHEQAYGLVGRHFEARQR